VLMQGMLCVDLYVVNGCYCLQNKMEVAIYRVTDGVKAKVPVVKVAQRDLFRKYGWPAKSVIVSSLKEMDI
jgi:hypothetical protein